MSLRNQPDVKTAVDSPKAAREAVDAAETLGLSLEGVETRGWWRGRDGAGPSHGARFEPEPGVGMLGGRRWFYFKHDGEIFAAEPVTSSKGHRDGEAILHFTD